MEWISVKEKFPEEGNNALVYLNDGRNCGHSIAYYRENNWWGGIGIYDQYPSVRIYYDDGGESSLESCYVTHWMPLPTPPKECQSDESIYDKGGYDLILEGL